MKFMTALFLASFAILYGWAQHAPSNQHNVVFREPFTLRLHVDKDHYYEERFEKRIPYVADNYIYLFSGERFGVDLVVESDQIVDVVYQPETKKSDVEFEFAQKVEKDGSAMMLLTIHNKAKKRLFLDALMTRPDAKAIYKTSILPVEAGLTNYESWPHPIVQLVLRDLRFVQKPPVSSKSNQ